MLSSRILGWQSLVRQMAIHTFPRVLLARMVMQLPSTYPPVSFSNFYLTVILEGLCFSPIHFSVRGSVGPTEPGGPTCSLTEIRT